jgi:RimJ/RimL family protein N-acetyltransferase
VAELTGNRVLLRDMTPEDAAALAADEGGRERLLKQIERRPTLEDGGFFSLAVEGDGLLVGDVQARAPKHGFPGGTCEIGITLFPGARGRGYGLEAVRLITEHLLDSGWHRVQASTSVDNVAMRKVLDRAGYEYEGVLRSYAAGDDDGREDYAMYAKTRT